MEQVSPLFVKFKLKYLRKVTCILGIWR